MPRKAKSSLNCFKQTSKKYTSPKRKSPPFKANLCCDEIMTGNDGNQWVSVANKKDVCTWKPVKQGAVKPSAAKVVKPSAAKVVKPSAAKVVKPRAAKVVKPSAAKVVKLSAAKATSAPRKAKREFCKLYNPGSWLGEAINNYRCRTLIEVHLRTVVEIFPKDSGASTPILDSEDNIKDVEKLLTQNKVYEWFKLQLDGLDGHPFQSQKDDSPIYLDSMCVIDIDNIYIDGIQVNITLDSANRLNKGDVEDIMGVLIGSHQESSPPEIKSNKYYGHAGVTTFVGWTRTPKLHQQNYKLTTWEYSPDYKTHTKPKTVINGKLDPSKILIVSSKVPYPKQSGGKTKPVKKCPSGKKLSPKGICVNVKKQSPVKTKPAKKCPSGKKLSPKGRCVNVKKQSPVKTKPAKKCPKGKKLSPKGRCVNVKKPSAGKPKPVKKCPKGKKLSPTGKCIKDTRYGRPSPAESAKLFKEGHKKRGGDGQMYRIVVTKNDSKRWQKV